MPVTACEIRRDHVLLRLSLSPSDDDTVTICIFAKPVYHSFNTATNPVDFCNCLECEILLSKQLTLSYYQVCYTLFAAKLQNRKMQEL